MKRFINLLLLTVLMFGWQASEACTSAIVTSGMSSNGQTLLWKHRDSRMANTRVRHITGGKYAYTALVHAKNSKIAYAGVNNKGFGIFNTATGNLPIDREAENTNKVTFATLITLALRECATVDEFEELVKTWERGPRFQTNIGVGDANGGAAYFEIWHNGYKRYNTADRTSGFDIRANYSFAGDKKKRGVSQRRYLAAEAQMKKMPVFTPEDLMALSRSYYAVRFKGSVLDITEKYNDNTQRCVPRQSSVAAVVIVCDGKNPRMDVVNGHPAACFPVTAWVEAGANLPKCITGTDMFKLSRDFRIAAYDNEKQGRRRFVWLNQDLTYKVVSATMKSCKKAPKKTPKDFTKYNASVEKRFIKHKARIDKLIQPVLAEKKAAKKR